MRRPQDRFLALTLLSALFTPIIVFAQNVGPCEGLAPTLRTACRARAILEEVRKQRSERMTLRQQEAAKLTEKTRAQRQILAPYHTWRQRATRTWRVYEDVKQLSSEDRLQILADYDAMIAEGNRRCRFEEGHESVRCLEKHRQEAREQLWNILKLFLPVLSE